MSIEHENHASDFTPSRPFWLKTRAHSHFAVTLRTSRCCPCSQVYKQLGVTKKCVDSNLWNNFGVTLAAEKCFTVGFFESFSIGSVLFPPSGWSRDGEVSQPFFDDPSMLRCRAFSVGDFGPPRTQTRHPARRRRFIHGDFCLRSTHRLHLWKRNFGVIFLFGHGHLMQSLGHT